MYTRINFNHPINVSAQVGDNVYISSATYASGSNIGFVGTTNTPEHVGIILEVGFDYIVVDKDPSNPPDITQGDYISFAKRIEANDSSLKGYYADITFKNSSHNKIELFAISSDINISSK